VLKIGDLELNPQQHEVMRSGQPIELTAREFTLLEFLLRRKETVVTRAMILDHVWDTDFEAEGGSNVVEVYINYLRRKVDAPFPRKLIHTIRGTGYILQEKD
jgi:DNA-binding response OmpR family regulator